SRTPPTAGGVLAAAVPAATAATTAVTGVNTLNSATLNVGDTSLFPAAGAIVLLGRTVTYTGKTATSFTGASNHPATTGGEAVAAVTDVLLVGTAIGIFRAFNPAPNVKWTLLGQNLPSALGADPQPAEDRRERPRGRRQAHDRQH